MILECKSCQKKFIVPDSAITNTGRLVQCSSCGNKWTQYPIKQKTPKGAKLIIITISCKNTVFNLANESLKFPVK